MFHVYLKCVINTLIVALSNAIIFMLIVVVIRGVEWRGEEKNLPLMIDEQD
jgi:hypothetical protein